MTGGAGFIGSAVARHLLSNTPNQVVNVDKLTYAGNLDSLANVSQSPNYAFEQVDICDRQEVERVIYHHAPAKILHLAAESHVDRSIDAPELFIQTNVIGTCTLLQVATAFWHTLGPKSKAEFRFQHVSTDEVYGDLGTSGGYFTESTSYAPSSPYAASKAGSDHLVRAWHKTYGLPILVTNCSNNFGPFQFPEKLIPLVILNALAGKPLPVYGQGTQVRDWLFVDDHVSGLMKVMTEGAIGETYNIGGGNEKKNIEVVQTICELLDKIVSIKPEGVTHFADLITFVEDRPGHDTRYAVDSSKIQAELGWKPAESFRTGIEKTVNWYLANAEWCDRVRSGVYRGERLGRLS